jgi:BON domain
MALSNFWRNARDRNRDERDLQSGRGSRYDNPEEQGAGFRRRGGWREGSDYYGNNPERYEAEGGDDAYGMGRYSGQDNEQSFGSRPTGRSESEASDFDREGRGSSFNDRWQNSYGDASSNRPFRKYGGYGGGDYGESGAYGGYGRARFGGGTQQFDESDVGRFRGRGPKGYRRSDERIREDVCECLTEDDHIDASNIDVTVKECEVTLSGTVSSRAEKRRAEDLIEHLPGVKDVHNQLRVASESTQSRTTSGLSDDGQPRQDIHH